MFKKYYYNNSALIIYIIEEKVKFYAIVINGFYKYFKEMFQMLREEVDALARGAEEGEGEDKETSYQAKLSESGLFVLMLQ